MKAKWLFFDIGDTLYDETLANKQRIESLIRKIDSNITYLEFYKEMEKAAKNFEPSPFKAARNTFGISDNEPYSSEAEILFPNTIDTIKKLSKVYKLGILANQPPDTVHRLKRDGLYDYFDICLISECENLFKPDLKFFKKAKLDSGCEANEIVMVGDRLDNDIYPAKKVGMRTVRIRQGLSSVQESNVPEYTADYVISNISELLNLWG